VIALVVMMLVDAIMEDLIRTGPVMNFARIIMIYMVKRLADAQKHLIQLVRSAFREVLPTNSVTIFPVIVGNQSLLEIIVGCAIQQPVRG